MNRQLPGAVARAAAALSFTSVGIALCYATASAQDRLKTMPGYAQYQKVSAQISGAVRSGAINGTWSADSGSIEYVLDGKRYRFDVAARSATEMGAAADAGRVRPRWTRRRARRDGHRAWTAGRVGRFAGRQAEGVLPRSQPVGERRRRRQRVRDHDRRQREGPHQERHGELGLRRGARPDDAPCGGRPTAARSPTTASTRSRCSTTTCSSIRPSIQSTNRRRGVSEGRCRQSDRRPVRLRRRREEDARRSTSATASRSTTAWSGTTSTASRWSPDGTELLFNRTNRRQNVMEFVAANPDTGVHARDRSRGVADRLGRQPAADAVPQGQHAASSGSPSATAWTNFYLYDLTGKLITPLTTHTTLRSGRHREGRRGGGRRLLHGARRRQLTEDAAAPRRARRQGRRPADRPGVPPHGRRRASRPRRRRRRARRLGGAGARAASRRTTSTSSTSTRRTTRRRPRALSTPDGQGRRRARQERPDEVRRARPEEGRDVHLQGGRRQDDAARA